MLIPVVCLVASLAVAGVYCYAIRIEPHRIEVTRHEAWFEDLPERLDGLVLCQISDLHITRPARNTQAILSSLRSVTADLYLLTGDQIRGASGMEEFLRRLPEIEPMIRPAFAVFGNAEHREDIDTLGLAKGMEKASVRTLLNSSVQWAARGENIQIVGVDDPHYMADDFEKAYAGADPSLFTILLCHSPDGLRNLNGYRADVALCGHTHAGQIRFPIVGALWANTRHVNLVHGWYGGEDLVKRAGAPISRTRVYVSRGLGTGRFAGRLLCPPELALITLRKGKAA